MKLIIAGGRKYRCSMALASLESAAESWIDAALETGQVIPEPVTLTGYSGKIALRIPRGLHKRAAEMASAEGTSLYQWLVSAIAHYLGATETLRAVISRAAIQVHVDYTANATHTYNIYGAGDRLIIPNMPALDRPARGVTWVGQPLGVLPHG